MYATITIQIIGSLTNVLHKIKHSFGKSIFAWETFESVNNELEILLNDAWNKNLIEFFTTIVL